MLSAMVELRRKESDSLRLVAFLWRERPSPAVPVS